VANFLVFGFDLVNGAKLDGTIRAAIFLRACWRCAASRVAELGFEQSQAGARRRSFRRGSMSPFVGEASGPDSGVTPRRSLYGSGLPGVNSSIDDVLLS